MQSFRMQSFNKCNQVLQVEMEFWKEKFYPIRGLQCVKPRPQCTLGYFNVWQLRTQHPWQNHPLHHGGRGPLHVQVGASDVLRG